MVLCPECESNIDVEEDEIDEGDVLSCDECGSEFEVVSQNPLELARISDDEEDEDDMEMEEDEE